MYFDTHAHYDDSKFDVDRHEIINKVHREGVSNIVNPSSTLESINKTIELCEKYEFMYGAVGIHPHDCSVLNDKVIQEIAETAEKPGIVAIGEIGLDYYYDNSPREQQKHWFAAQINLAVEIGLPVIVHDREAHQDVLDIIIKEKARKTGGVLHAYSGSVEMVEMLLDQNFYISVGGVVTFKNAKKIVDVIRYLPEDRLLVETDSPYLTPHPYRGRRNNSGYLKYIVEKIAEIKGCSIEKIASVTQQNAKKFFNIGLDDG